MPALADQSLEQLINDATRTGPQRLEVILRRSLSTLSHIANQLPYAGADARQAATVALADIRDQLAAEIAPPPAATEAAGEGQVPWPTEAPSDLDDDRQ